MDEKQKPNNNPLASIINGLTGKSTSLDVKPKSDGIHIEVDGIDQKIALKHIRNMINDLIGSE